MERASSEPILLARNPLKSWHQALSLDCNEISFHSIARRQTGAMTFFLHFTDKI
jgi:hypothetical protein